MQRKGISIVIQIPYVDYAHAVTLVVVAGCLVLISFA